jgi:hypothetical protein
MQMAKVSQHLNSNAENLSSKIMYDILFSFINIPACLNLVTLIFICSLFTQAGGRNGNIF